MARLCNRILSLTLTCFLASFVASTTPPVKKGGAMTSGRTLCGDLAALTSVGWWYDWSPDRTSFAKVGCPLDPLNGGGVAEYVPMIAGLDGLASVNETRIRGSKYLIGYNEPENHHKIKAADGARYWSGVEALAERHNLTLVAPCVGNYAHPNDKKWLKDWQTACQQLYGRPCRHDHVCTHVYFSGHDAVNDLSAMLDQMYTDLQQPIWLNEFAYGIHNVTAADQLSFMQAALPIVQSHTSVFRYSWYVSRHVSDDGYNNKRGSSLLQENRSSLTPLGVYYNSFNSSF